MREKIRLIIIIALALISAVSIFMGLQAYASKRAAEAELNKLKSENEMLSKRIEEAIQERNKLKERANALSIDLDKASKEKQDVQRQYELIVKEKNEVSEKADALRKNNQQLRTDLSNLQRERQRLGQRMEDDLAPLRSENDQLKQQLDSLNSAKANMEAELGKLKEEKSDFEQKLDEIDRVLEQNLTPLRYARVREQVDSVLGRTMPQEAVTEPSQTVKGPVELPPIVVKPQAQSKPEASAWTRKPAAAKPSGTILDVNKENKFVVVDLGLDENIKVGKSLTVYKEGVPVATVEVIQVRQNISACDIKQEIKPIEPGDIVR